MEEALRRAERREYLGKEMNRQKMCCPMCETRQIQLLAYIEHKPANWKCRKCGKCGFRFEWDPD